MDCGGLIHVGDGLYMVFVSLELRKHFAQRKMMQVILDMLKITENVLQNDDVLFYWTLVAINWTEETFQELLKLITEHWIAIRNFPHASAFLELYKQGKKIDASEIKKLKKKTHLRVWSIISLTI